MDLWCKPRIEFEQEATFHKVNKKDSSVGLFALTIKLKHVNERLDGFEFEFILSDCVHFLQYTTLKQIKHKEM